MKLIAISILAGAMMISGASMYGNRYEWKGSISYKMFYKYDKLSGEMKGYCFFDNEERIGRGIENLRLKFYCHDID